MQNPTPIAHLISSEGDIFELSRDAIEGSKFLKEMYDPQDEENIQEFPVLQVSSKTLKKIVSFLEQSVIEPMTKIETPITSLEMSDLVQLWYADFVNKLSDDELFDIILGANYMDIPALMDLTCAKVASMIRGKTTEQICARFDVEYHNMTFDDAELRKKYPWVQDAPPMPED